jgi:hypothetical protein
MNIQKFATNKLEKSNLTYMGIPKEMNNAVKKLWKENQIPKVTEKNKKFLKLPSRIGGLFPSITHSANSERKEHSPKNSSRSKSSNIITPKA